MLIRLRRDGENGAVLVLTAMLLLVLMGFAALAVDAASAWSKRRQIETAADIGVLAGAEAIVGTFVNEVDGAVDDVVKRLVAVNSPGAEIVDPVAVYEPGEAEPGQPDPCARAREAGRLCLTNVSVGISGDSDNAFAPAIGAADTIDVSSGDGEGTTEAQIYLIEYPQLKLLPIGVDDLTGSPLLCSSSCSVYVYDPPEPPPPPEPPEPPEPPDTGPIGSEGVSLRALRRIDTGCTDAAETTIANLLSGADHLVGIDAQAGDRDEETACGPGGHELTMPNWAKPVPDGTIPEVVTGGIQSLVPDGYVNQVHLWQYLTSRVGVVCNPASYAPDLLLPDPPPWVDIDPDIVRFSLATDLMEECLSGDSSEPSFSPAIVDDPRLGWALEMDGNRFVGFIPLWIHSVLDATVPGELPLVSLVGDDGYSVFVLDQAWLSDATDVDPSGRLSFKLID